MSLNPTKIEWCDRTWNATTGCYGPGGTAKKPQWCPYCFARKMAMRFDGHFIPTFHPDRLLEPLKIKKPLRIFAGSMGEMLADDIPPIWIKLILDVMEYSPWHTYIILTKNSAQLTRWNFPSNCWVGVSVDGKYNEFTQEVARNLSECNARNKIICYEPLLDYPLLNKFDIGRWVIVGAQTNPYRPPKKEWVQAIIDECRDLQISIFLKNNLRWPVKIQEFPIIRGDRSE